MKIIFIFIVTISLYESECASTSRVVSRVSGSCGLERFQCRNGDCIAGHLLCDGRADCKDSSDETETECNKPEIICSEYAFRCAYGACVDGDAACNNIRDCIDNSDETLFGCPSSSSNATVECLENQFQCNDGQCIANTLLCDGTPDCNDRSDETATKCGSFNCPQLVFRCNYGACIDGDLKCNGVNNCADGSDEDPKLCDGHVITGSVTTSTTMRPGPRPTPNRPTTTTTRRPHTQSPWTPKPKQMCTVPAQPNNGAFMLHRSQCPSGEHCHIQEGLQVEQGSYLIYNCNEGFRMNGSRDVLCSPEGKWRSIPNCIEIRCKPLRSASTEASCTYDDEYTSCESSVLPRTVAKLTCRNSYREDIVLTRQRNTVRCNERGQWEPEPIRCIPVCGISPGKLEQGVITPNATTLIVNGTTPEISEFPWHATLYREVKQTGEKEFICGATIIQENLLITAAHCVYDEVNKKVFDAKSFYVATGNIFRDYDSSLHSTYVKKSQVNNIYVICNYFGFEGNFAEDIAILEIVQPFVFSSLLVPICIDTTSYGYESVLESGNYGKVAGFGRTAVGSSSFILQAITVPYISITQCKSSSAVSESEKFITYDKFCAGYINGSSVCDGDSGGGLVFKSNSLWYLRGIVSVGIGTTLSGGTRSCDSHSYSLYTRVSSHIGWIQDVILKLETNKTIPRCPTTN